MKTLGRNADNDLYLEAGGLAILHDADAQCAVIESILQTQRGELQFNENGGIDYFGTVLQSPRYIEFWAAQVKSKIESLSFVAAVEDFTYRFDAASHTLFWSMTIVNTENERLDLQNKKMVLDGSPGIDVDWKDIYDKPTGTDDALKMVKDMRDEAQDLDELNSRSTLAKVKDVLNRVVYDPNDEEYSASRLLEFSFVGVPLGTVIDFSNIRVNLLNSGTAASPKYVPFTIEISDGTKQRNLTNMDGSDLGETGNDVWFTEEDSSTGTYRKTQKHTIMSGGNVTVRIRGNITGLISADETNPIFLKSNGTVFPYLYGLSVGDRTPLFTIGISAFKGFKNLQEVQWHESSESSFDITFGNNAFEGCEALKGLEWIPSRLQSIGTECFKNCKSMTSLKGLVVGESATSLPDGCFEGCTSLTAVAYIPEHVSKIGNRAFYGCTSLKNVDELPDGIVELGEECFGGCTGIETVLYLPTALDTVKDRAFYGCSSLRSLYLPNSVAEIGVDAFGGCTSLTNVMCERTTPPSIVSGGASAFDQATLDVYVPIGALDEYKAADGWKRYWTDEAQTIYEYGQANFLLQNITKGTEFIAGTGEVISNSIWSVEYTNTDTRPVRFEATTTALPAYTYSAMPESGVSAVIVKGFIKRMSAHSSSAYPMLATEGNQNPHLVGLFLDLAPSLEMIGDYAFAGCENLWNVSTTGSELPFCLGERAFYGCTSLTTTGWLNVYPNLGTLIESEETVYDLDENGNIQYDEQGNPITHIEYTYYPAFGEGCFMGAGITELSYPREHVVELTPYCFAGTRISSLEGMGSSVLTDIGEHCFEGCGLLQGIAALADTDVTVIPVYCFAGCTSLTSLVGVTKIREIGEHAFEGCTGLTTIKGLLSASELASLPAYCFAGCTSLTNLDGIQIIISLGEYAFSGCTGLDSLRKLMEASHLIDGEAVKLSVIPPYCFERCTGLMTLVGCYNIETIGEGAFSNCTGLRSSSGLGPSIASIGHLAFVGCTGLNYFSCIASSVPALGSSNVFGGIERTIPLYVRDGMETAFQNVSGWSSFQSVSSRTVRIRFDNLDVNDINNVDVVADSYVKAEIKNGDGIIDGVWYVDFGDGSAIEPVYAEDQYGYRMPLHQYAARGAYDITLFGDIVSIQGRNVNYVPSKHGDPEGYEVSQEHSFLNAVRDKASAITISSNYLTRIGDFCFRKYGRDSGTLSLAVNMADNGTIGAYAFAKTAPRLGATNNVIDISAFDATVVEPFAFYYAGLDSSLQFGTVVETKKGAFAYNVAMANLSGFGSLVTIGEETFRGCTSLTSTTGLSSAATIGDRAFQGCMGLTNVRDFGPSLTTIGSGAFAGCDNIADIFIALDTPPALPADGFSDDVFDNSILYVPAGKEETYANTDYWSKFGIGIEGRIRSRAVIFHLVGVSNGNVMPDKVATVTASGAWTISYGSQLSRTYQAGETKVDGYTFTDGPAGQYDIDVRISGPVTAISGNLFGSTVGKMLYSVESSSAMEVNTFGDNLFAGCENLVSVTTASTVTTLGENVFSGAKKLTDISGLTGVSIIGANAFENCVALKSLYGLHSATTIGDRAFAGCSALKTIDGLGMGVTSIGESAFEQCIALSEVQMFADTPPTAATTAFSGVDLTAVPLYVRTKSISSYRNDAVWGRFTNIRSRYVEFIVTNCPANATTRGDVGKVESDTFWVVDWDAYDFNGVPSREGESNNLPAHTYSLSGSHTFRIEGAVTKIAAGTYALEQNEPDAENVITGTRFLMFEDGGDYLTNVVRSEFSSLVEVGTAAFLHSENLKTADLAGITTVGDAAFAFSGIESLALLQSVSDIGDYAFYGCPGFHNVTNLGGESITIGDYAFARIGTDEARLKYIQISVQQPENAVITATSFGYFASETEQKKVFVYVPMDSVYPYSVYPLWEDFTVASQLIEFTLENVPSGTTILGVSANDSVGTGRVISDSEWTIDWGDGTRSTMSQSETSFPAHTYEYTEENAGYWSTQVVGGVETRLMERAVISISGSIRFIGCQSVNNSPFLATARGGGNPYLTKIVASDSMVDLTTIGDYAFQGCTALESVSGFTNVQTIGKFAFQGCTNLVGLGNADSGFANATAIGNQAFADCSSLMSLVAFPKVLSIGVRAFANCISLAGTSGLGKAYQELTYEQCPVATFAAYAFEGCDFGIINMEGYARPPVIQSTTFPGDPKDVIVEVQPDSLSAYKVAAIWKQYWDNIIAAAPISITFGPGVITAGKAIYGGNGRLAFSGSYVVIDWGDGTVTKSTTDSATRTNPWTMPNHIYADDFAGGGSVTVGISGQVSDIWSDDKTKPFIAISESGTRTETDETTGTTTTVTELVGEPITDASILSVSFGRGSFLVSVGESSFIGCNIASISFGKPTGDRAIAIGDSAFEGCVYTNVVTAEEGTISSVGECAFKGCTLLGTVDFLSGCRSIGVSAFEGCTALQEILLPASLLSVCERAFYGCTGILRGITWEEAENPLVLGNGDISIGSEAFRGCTGINNEEWSIYIPSQVHNIGSYAFAECGMASLEWSTAHRTGSYQFVPDSTHTFANCPNLKSVTALLPNVPSIPNYAFVGCSQLGDTSFLPASVVSLGSHSFEGCSLAMGISLPAESLLTTIGDACFKDCMRDVNGVATGGTIDLSNAQHLTTMYSDSFEGCGETYLRLPGSQNQLNVPDYAFAYHTNLRGVNWDIGNATPTVGAHCFEGCSNLMTVESFGGITTLPSHCFFLCESLRNIDEILANAVGTVGGYCFAGCRNLGNVTIPALVERLGEGCFNCSSELFLRGVYDGEEPADLRSRYGSIAKFESWMYQKYKDKRVDVWRVYDEICYQADAVGPNEIAWGRYMGSAEHGDGSLGAGCFMNCNEMYFRNELPEMTDIPAFCFYNCASMCRDDFGLDRFISDVVASIGKFSFAHVNLTSLAWSGSQCFATLSPAAFLGCTNLQSLSGLEKVFGSIPSALPDAAFYGCSALSDISVLKAAVPVAALGNYCFAGCTSIKFDNLAGSVFDVFEEITKIGDGCFEACLASSGSSKVYVPKKLGYYPYRCFADNVSATTIVFTYSSTGSSTAKTVSLEGDAFAGCTKVWEIDLPFPAVADVVMASGMKEDGTEFESEDPFPSIAPVSGGPQDGKKNAYVKVPENFVSKYEEDTYWSNFRGILASDAEIPVVDNPIVRMNLSVPAEGCTMTLTGSISIPSGETVSIDWGDGDTTELGSDYSNVSHTYSAGTSAREYWISISGAVISMSGIAVTDGGTTYYKPCFSSSVDDVTHTYRNTVVTRVEIVNQAYNEGGNPIGAYCFCWHSSLQHIVVYTDGIDKISDFTFFECRNLKNFEVLTSKGGSLENLISIGAQAFRYAGLTSLSFLSTATRLRTIGERCFYSIDITDLSGLPSSITEIGSGAFSWCGKLQSLKGFDGLTSDKITAVPIQCFRGCKKLTNIGFMPRDVTTLLRQSFSECESLTDLTTLPSRITAIGDYAFQNSGLTTIAALSGWESLTIGVGAFSGTQIPNLIGIPDETTVLPAECFKGCSSLASLEGMPNTVVSLGDSCFMDCTKLASLGNISNHIITLGNNCFAGCTALSNLNGLPNTITELSNGCFQNCKLTSLIGMPNSIITLGNNCFAGCTQLEDLTGLPTSIKNMGIGCFQNCTGLKDLGGKNSIDVVDGLSACKELKTLPDYCFKGCTSLRQVVYVAGQDYECLSENLEGIGVGCFEGCESIVFIGLSRPLSGSSPITYISSTSFEGAIIKDGLVVQVPSDALSTYKNDSEWQAFSAYMVTPPIQT